MVTKDREVEWVIGAGPHGKVYPRVVAALEYDELGRGDATGRVDVVLVIAGDRIEIRSHGQLLAIVPERYHATAAKALASVPADAIAVRAKLWRSAKDGTYGVRLYLPWGLRPVGG